MSSDIDLVKCLPTKVRTTPEGWVVWKCARGCGFTDIDKVGHFPNKIYPLPCGVQKRGLGDAIAWLLDMLGITQERINEFKMRPVVCGGFIATWQVPEKKAPCGCPARRQAINRCDFVFRQRLNNAGWWIWHRFVFATSILRRTFKANSTCVDSDDVTN